MAASAFDDDLHLAGLTKAEREFFNVMREQPQRHISQDAALHRLACALPELEAIINSLLNKGLLDIFQMADGLHFREVKPAEVLKLRELSAEERALYVIIRQAGNTGIWTRDIRHKTSFQQATMTKLLKNLESRKIIKSVKSVESKNKKLYMLYELEPSKEVTGGAWYTEQDFDKEFASTLMMKTLQVIQKRTLPKDREEMMALHYEDYPTLATIHEDIIQSGVSKIDFSDDEISMILDALIANNKIERLPNGSYRAIRPSQIPIYVTNVPCATCPVFNFCSENGPINPRNCIYLDQWKAKMAI